MLYNFTLSERCPQLMSTLIPPSNGVRYGRKASGGRDSGTNFCLYHRPAVPQPEEGGQVALLLFLALQPHLCFGLNRCPSSSKTQVLVREWRSSRSIQPKSAPRN